jgi:DNA-binding CsgD family transcriptional regulator
VLTDGATPRRVVLIPHRPAAAGLRVDSLGMLAAAVPVLVATTEDASATPVFAAATAEVHHVRLAPLSTGDVHRLITGLLGAPPGDHLLDLARVGAGRPGAVRDLIAGLLEEDLVRLTGGVAVLARVRLPARTHACLAHHLATLSPSARHLVQAATTLPSPFPLASLGRLLRCGPVTLLPDLEEALDSGLLVDVRGGLSLSHDLVRPIVEASMPRAVVAALAAEHDRARSGNPTRPQAGPRRRDGGRRARGTADRQAGQPSGGPVDWSLLSDREREIAELVGQALTNRQIANRVDRSPHTVNYHLRQIFRKLGLASRVELVSLLRRLEAASSAPNGATPLPR